MRILLALAAFAALVSPALASDDLSPEVRAAYTYGALSLVNAYVSAHPTDGNGYAARCSINEAAAIRARKPIDEATFADCRKGIELSPASGFAHYVFGNALYDAHKIALGLTEYTKAVDLGETEFGILWKRCDAFRRTGNLDAAATDCDRQLQLTPNDVRARTAHGILSFARGNYDATIKDMTVALAAEPGDINTLYWRGAAEAQSKQYAEAETDLSACIGMGDQSPDTYYYRGIARSGLGKKTDALADLAHAAAAYRDAGMSDGLVKAQVAISALTGKQASYAFAGVKFTQDDIKAFFSGVRTALNGSDTTVQVQFIAKAPSEMPAYDQDWHYVSTTTDPDGTRHINVWVSTTLGGAKLARGKEAAIILGLADSGYANPKWKEVFDKFKGAEDAKSSDPMEQQRSLGNALAQLYETSGT